MLSAAPTSAVPGFAPAAAVTGQQLQPPITHTPTDAAVAQPATTSGQAADPHASGPAPVAGVGGSSHGTAPASAPPGPRAQGAPAARPVDQGGDASPTGIPVKCHHHHHATAADGYGNLPTVLAPAGSSARDPNLSRDAIRSALALRPRSTDDDGAPPASTLADTTQSASPAGTVEASPVTLDGPPRGLAPVSGLPADVASRGAQHAETLAGAATGGAKDVHTIQVAQGSDVAAARGRATEYPTWHVGGWVGGNPAVNDLLFDRGGLSGAGGPLGGVTLFGPMPAGDPAPEPGPVALPGAGADVVANAGMLNDGAWASYGGAAEGAEGVVGSVAGLCLAAGFFQPRPNSDQFSILVVESDEATRDAMTVRLVRDGYWVLPAATGREAWKLLRAPFSAIDLVVLDGHLSDISSVQLCRLLRDRYPHLPVLVYAGPTAHVDLPTFGQLGVQHYFRKPVDLEILLQTAEGILSH